MGTAGDDNLTGSSGPDLILGLGGNDLILDFQVGVDKFVVGDQQGGASGAAAVAFSALADGNTLVTVGAADALLYQIEVHSLGGTISASDIQFSFLG